MKKNKLLKIFTASCLIGLFQSCTEYKFSKNDLKNLPYKINDTLVFKSSTNKVDSIVITEINKFSNPDDPLSVFPDKHEVLFVSGEIIENCINRKDGSPTRVEILKMFADKKSTIEFNLNKIGDTMVYAKATYSIKELEEIYTNSKQSFFDSSIDGLKILTDETYNLNHDLNYVYWNNKFGYIGYEFKNGMYWKLEKFIRKGENILDK